MTVDLTGGLEPDWDYVFPSMPETPEMRDAVNIWAWDDSGKVGFPRFAVEAIAPNWDEHEFQLSIGFPDGRLLRNWTKGATHSPLGADGRSTILGAGPLAFETIEPFGRFRTTYDGEVWAATFDDFARSLQPDNARRIPIRFEMEYEPAVPPFIQGTMSEEAKQFMSGGTEADFMGGKRFEQLCRLRGRIIVDGQEEHSFTGGALRIRRQGVRHVSGFWGHCWQSAVFPSGKAFGYIAYPPRPDGQPSYNEGYVFIDGEMIPAKVTDAPWLDHFQFNGEDVGMTLETPRGSIRIDGETTMGMPTMAHGKENFPPLFQSIVRYRWDGEEVLGMMERSNLPERVTLPV